MHMKLIDVAKEPEAVQRFFRTLAKDSLVKVLMLKGGPFLKVQPIAVLTPVQRKALLAKARERTKNVPAKVLQKEIEAAIRHVRRKS